MPGLDRTVEAVVLDWDGIGASARRATARAVSRRVDALVGYGVAVAVVGAGGVDEIDGQLRARPVGSGRLFLAVHSGAELFVVDEHGPRPAARRSAPAAENAAPGRAVLAVLRRFAERGIGPGLTLLIGGSRGAPPGAPGRDPVLPAEAGPATVVSVGADPAGTPARGIHRPDGTRQVLGLLDEQLRRRRTRRVPSVDEDPDWTLSVGGDGGPGARVLETLLTLGDGVISIRGSHEEVVPGEVPMVVASGVYAGDGPAEHLAAGPSPLALTVGASDARERRVLDLRTGVLLREHDGVRTLRFVAAGRHGVVALRAEGPPQRLAPGPLLHRPTDSPLTTGRIATVVWARTGSGHGGIAAAADESVSRADGRRTIERLTAYVPNQHRTARTDRAVAALDRVRRLGFDRLLSEHRATWARRWGDACVSIPDDPPAQLAARYALFQLWNSVSAHGESGVGARGLSGTAYAGHVFWDADVFVLPAITCMTPTAARAMLEYRIRRLPAARATARAMGRDGARFPWESASAGTDVTPTFGSANGVTVPILTGRLEEHIDADVAWAACHYAEWTGDAAFLVGPGRPLVAETARYWASRCSLEPDGRAHIRHVIGPDEYHEDVDDNAYTNILARWNLRRAAALEGPSAETARWRRLADALVDGYDARTRRHEQFAGYDDLEPLTTADVGTPPLPADVVLGAARASATQIVKQPDVLMAHHLVPDEMPDGSLGADVDFYVPRTAHGSSLSPAITAALLARAGRPDEAMRDLDIALRLDLDDLTGSTGAGLHLATLGGVWQALLFGFAGVRVADGVLTIDPRLPQRWGSLQLRFRCRRRRVELRMSHDSTVVSVSGPLLVRAAGSDVVRVTKEVRFDKTDAGWAARR